MAAKRGGARVLGPYKNGSRWGVVAIGEDGRRDTTWFAVEVEAQKLFNSLARRVHAGSVTIATALEGYRLAMIEKGNRPGSIATTMFRLNGFFPKDGGPLHSITPDYCSKAYNTLRLKQKTDTHRNTLAEAKTFLRWCMKKGWFRRNPAEGIEGKGARQKGKLDQLRIDEARLWAEKAYELADQGEAGAVAALVSLLMGLRASEITARQVRDLDDNGHRLCIDHAKTAAGRRVVEVPDRLRPYLLELADGKKGDALLFGYHWRDWPREWVQRICTAAEVPQTTAHSMRGLHSTLAIEAGATGHLVSKALGHTKESVTQAHYTKPSATRAAKQKRTMKVLG